MTRYRCDACEHEFTPSTLGMLFQAYRPCPACEGRQTRPIRTDEQTPSQAKPPIRRAGFS